MFVRVVNCTRTPAALRPVEPSAGAGSRSRTVTDNPREARCPAVEAPTIPAPMTTMSGARPPARGSRTRGEGWVWGVGPLMGSVNLPPSIRGR